MEQSSVIGGTAWSMPRLMGLATGYWGSAALSAAVELGVFEALDAGPSRTADELAAALRAAPVHLARLLDALVGLGLLIKREDRYGIEPAAAALLAPSSPTSVLDALRFNSDLYPLWGRLGQGVRSGQPVVPPTAHLGGDPERTRRFVRGMNSRGRTLLPPLAAAIDLTGRRQLVDIGAGPGLMSRLLLARHPDLRATLFDLPGVLEVARELVDPTPEAGRVSFAPGDYRADALPRGDAMIYVGALHQETPESAAALLGRMRAALAPGGRLWVIDMMLEDDDAHPVFSALFSITMMLTSPRGRVFRGSDTLGLMGQAGFVHVTLDKGPGGSGMYWIASGTSVAES